MEHARQDLEPQQEVETEEVTVVRLALLSPQAYDRVRKDEAARLGVRVTTLDDQVRQARAAAHVPAGDDVDLPAPQPWLEPVRLTDLLTEITTAIARHVVLPPEMVDLIALWIAHTWVSDQFDHTPRLGITSPTRQCGKSTLLEVLRHLCMRPLKADNVSSSSTFRIVQALSPITLLIDEVDTFLSANDELRGILNSGFEKSGRVLRVAEIKGEHRPVTFRTFAPVALAAIGSLPSTLEDRAIPIRLERKGANEAVEKLRDNGNRDVLRNLASKIARWAADNGMEIGTTVKIPAELGDREGDISVPLVVIADHAGDDWPGRVRRALLKAFRNRAREEASTDIGGALLSDIRRIFGGTTPLRLTSGAICKELAVLEDRPWPEFRNGKPISPAQLASVLRPFGIRPVSIKQTDGAVLRGYRASDFAEAWARYLPPVESA
jgi:hypothetical protein